MLSAGLSQHAHGMADSSGSGSARHISQSSWACAFHSRASTALEDKVASGKRLLAGGEHA